MTSAATHRPCRWLPLCIPLGLIAVALAVVAAGPRIDHIEVVKSGSSNLIILHFEIEAKRTYTVQRCTSFIQTTNGVSGVWSNIEVVPPHPSNDHWIGVDMLPVAPDTNLPVRFYRLMVTP